MSQDLEYILMKIQESRNYAETSIIQGGLMDYTEYKVMCMKVRVLNEVEELISERFKQIEET